VSGGRCPKCGGYSWDDGVCKFCGYTPQINPRFELGKVDIFELAEGLKKKEQEKEQNKFLKNLGEKEQERRKSIPRISDCPYCHENSLYYNPINDRFECLNKKTNCQKYSNPIVNDTQEYKSIIENLIKKSVKTNSTDNKENKMPLSNRDYIKGEHPPACTCVDCVSKRLGIYNNQKQKHIPSQKDETSKEDNNSLAKQDLVNNEIPQLEKDETSKEDNNSLAKQDLVNNEIPQLEKDETSLEDNNSLAKQDLVNNDIPRPEHKDKKQFRSTKRPKKKATSKNKSHNWGLISLLLIFSLSILGLGISYFVGIFIPFWILVGFSIIYSIEKWFSYITRKYKVIGNLYRLLLNLSILSVLGILIWSGIKLFSHQFGNSALFGSLVFFAEFIFFIWIWKVVAKNSWRWPSMKLTIFVLVILFLVLAFAGVPPISDYKDKLFSPFNTSSHSSLQQTEAFSSTTLPVTSITSTKLAVSIPLASNLATTPATTTQKVINTNSFVAGKFDNIDTSRFDVIDQYALKVPDSVTTSINSLANYLVMPAKNDFEKARAIYRWITQNISYDYSGYLTGNYKSTSADDVLKNRSSVCQGYSRLFESLAKSAGLDVVLISGWAKGISYKVGEPIIGKTNHAWNALKIDGGWYLIDCTWGAGYISGGQFVRNFDEHYFFTPPESLIYNHLPEDTNWQLLPQPISKTKFSELPYVYSSFFSFNVGFGDNNHCVIQAGNKLIMRFTVSINTYLIVNLYEGNTELPETLTSINRSGNSCTISINFPKPSDYLLRIYARSGDPYGGDYNAIMEYKIISGSTS
jgi:hypothetical protein